MKKTLFWGVLLSLLTACQGHFIKDDAVRNSVHQHFIEKQQLMQGDYFDFSHLENLSGKEREAMEFLYAYMPLADITNYPSSFHLMNVRSSENTRQIMPWGKDIPDELYRHFVLPERVNNEALDSARVVFYRELKDRVKHLSMKDAILEVNHWCHEKVVYTPSDARTSSPLATVRTAYGRCGEESTLLVAALRAVGIPARQVYTPRWAHTDDNHAWVEAWADGKWYFLGACEPEPVLNLAWFNAPASRGMLMHTRVFGKYNGPEEVMSVRPTYTEINVIGNYALTAKATITVLDTDGRKVADALVEFKLYNYAEFYTVAKKYTNDKGECSLTAGKGDVLVWASKNGKYGVKKLSFGKQENLSVALDKDDQSQWQEDLDIVPPAEHSNIPEVTAEQREQNNKRMALEDSIRNSYVSTFKDDSTAWMLARQWDTVLSREELDKLQHFLVASRGNYNALLQLMTQAHQAGKAKLAVEMLGLLTAKDLRDADASVLMSELLHTPLADSEYFANGVLNPRIDTEKLTPYKEFFQKVIPQNLADSIRHDVGTWVKWCNTHIQLNDSISPRGIIVSPEGVWKGRTADALSRDVFFVAVLRSLGIPAWIDMVTRKVMYAVPANNEVQQVDFQKGVSENEVKGILTATYHATPLLDNPKYYNHFTLSKISQGTIHLLNYDEGTTSWENLLQPGCTLSLGNYLLVTGTRLADGGVLAHLQTVKVEPKMKSVIPLVIREDKDKIQVIGSFNSESLFSDLGSQCTLQDGSCRKSILQACGRGYFIIGILGVNQEPTNHALRDIASLSEEINHWGRTMVLLFPDQEAATKFNPSAFGTLPKNIVYGIDTNGIAGEIIRNMKLKSNLLPIFIIADTFNRVVFVQQGYTIGLGEQLMKVIKGLE